MFLIDLQMEYPQQLLGQFKLDYLQHGKFNASVQRPHLVKLAEFYETKYKASNHWADCIKVNIEIWYKPIYLCFVCERRHLFWYFCNFLHNIPHCTIVLPCFCYCWLNHGNVTYALGYGRGRTELITEKKHKFLHITLVFSLLKLRVVVKTVPQLNLGFLASVKIIMCKGWNWQLQNSRKSRKEIRRSHSTHAAAYHHPAISTMHKIVKRKA